MSPESCPARSVAGSVAGSVDELTMQSSRDASPLQLTPRSKIKAMLAAVDDESDAKDVPDMAKSTMFQGRSSGKSPSRTAHTSGRSTTNSEESDDEPVRARGKLAARLQRKPMTKIPSGGSPAAANGEEEEQDAGNAYERVKLKMLLKASEVRNEDKEASAEQDSADDEEDTPVVPRRRRKKGDSDTPKSPLRTPVRSRRSSPGLFLTPRAESEARSPTKLGPNDENSSPSKSVADQDSDSDLPSNPATNERFLALVARKRAERQAQEAAEAEKRAAREAQYEQEAKKGASRRSATPLGSSEDDSDDATAKKLTQQARPTRKASKKALEEMNRETQRMNRNMQLAHQARTKKKITKESLFARFNFRTTNTPSTDPPQTLSSSTAVSSAPVSEAEGAPHQATPPTSPSAPQESPKLPTTELGDVELRIETHVDQAPSEDEEMPTVQDMMSPPLSALQNGKGKAKEPEAKDASVEHRSFDVPERKPIKVRFPKAPIRSKNQKDDSDSDLEIVPARKSRSKLDVFNRQPQGKPSEARSLQTLRALAHLNSPDKASGKARASMTLSDMQKSLQQRARQQAAAERAERIQDLKDRGIIVQTAEERQKDQVEVEDLVEKARQEAVDIKKKEKNAAKRAAKKNGEDFEDSSDDEDEDYEANEADESEIELSGSEEEVVPVGSGDELGEEEDEGDEEENDDAEEGEETNGLVENEAMEDADDEDTSEAAEEDEDEVASDQDQDVNPRPRKMKVKRIVDEDDEEGPGETKQAQHLAPMLETPRKPNVPSIALGTSPGLMGMTQAFEATMADSQTQKKDIAELDTEQDSMSFLGPVPEPNIPLFEANESESMIVDSQAEAPAQDTITNDINLDFTQSQIDDEPLRDTQDPLMATQDFEIPDPTQDMGFHLSSPAGNRFVPAPPSTVDTVLLPESPIKKKKGRLQRRRDTSVAPSEVVPSSLPHAENLPISADAFEIMKKKRNAAATTSAFDKKKSNAKEMVEEQAQESEDEYAGLGGASDDESGGEEDEDLKRMIEHGDVEVDERKLAAFYADKERASDEQAISKLYKDINNGGLRRKRGAEFDLSDSDDDAEARRRAKRQEFARMRKALLADEKLGKIAEDPKKMAFLKAVEDREDEEDLGVGWDILETPQDDQADSTQEVADSQAQPTDGATTGQKRKRPLQESLTDAANRPPPAARRTKIKRPATLAEIRESVSFLIETPESMSFQSHAPESSDVEDDEIENRDTTLPADPEDPINEEHDDGTTEELMPPPPLPQHRNPRRTSAPIIDRLSLKRASSANQVSNNSDRFAFAAPSATTTNFNVPSLLRRASTSALAQNDNHGITTLAATEQAAGGGDGKAVYVKRGGRKGSSILGQAREMERRAVVEGIERRRKEERERIARIRREGFLSGGGGSWEG